MATDQSGRRPKFDPEQRDAKADVQDEHRAFNSTVGESIRRARQEHGWTQAFLAEQAGLSPNYVARLERGELGPSLFVASRICEALTVQIDSLVAPPSGTQQRAKATSTGGTKRRALAG